MNSVTAEPCMRDRLRSNLTFLSANSMIRDERARGTTIIMVMVQSIEPMMAIAPTPYRINHQPSANSSVGKQASSASSRMRPMVSLGLSEIAWAPGFCEINRIIFRRTSPVSRCQWSPQTQAAARCNRDRVRPKETRSNKTERGY